MDIRKVGGNTEFGLNADEAHMAYTGFANPTTYGSASQDLFLDRYMPYRDAHEGEYEQILARGQVIELLWLPALWRRRSQLHLGNTELMVIALHHGPCQLIHHTELTLQI